MDDSTWFASSYNVILLMMVMLFILFQFFALPFTSAALLPFMAVTALASAAATNIGILVGLVVVSAGVFYFLYSRFDFNDLATIGLFLAVILLVSH